MDITKIPGFKPSMGPEERVKLMNHALASARTEREAAFEAILDLESEAKGAQASVQFMPGNLPLYLRESRFKEAATAKARLFAALTSLPERDAKAFGGYRKIRR